MFYTFRQELVSSFQFMSFVDDENWAGTDNTRRPLAGEEPGADLVNVVDAALVRPGELSC
jgi:hypothetical protein